MQEADHIILRAKAEQYESQQTQAQHEAVPDEGCGRSSLEVVHEKEDAEKARNCRGKEANQEATCLVNRNTFCPIEHVIQLLQSRPQHNGR